jgi:hypothetical protein
MEGVSRLWLRTVPEVERWLHDPRGMTGSNFGRAGVQATTVRAPDPSHCRSE